MARELDSDSFLAGKLLIKLNLAHIYPFVPLHELPRFSLVHYYSRTSPQRPRQNKVAVVERWSLVEV